MSHPADARAPRDPRRHERGSALLLVTLILVALLAGGAIALYVQVLDVRSTGLVRQSRTSLYCAEAGLAAARRLVADNMQDWTLILDADPGNNPVWYPVTGDLDADGVDDYVVTVRDNDDEASPVDNDPTVDLDQRVFVVSACVSNADVPRELTEMLSFSGAGHLYRNQAGQGAGNTGNVN